MQHLLYLPSHFSHLAYSSALISEIVLNPFTFETEFIWFVFEKHVLFILFQNKTNELTFENKWTYDYFAKEGRFGVDCTSGRPRDVQTRYQLC